MLEKTYQIVEAISCWLVEELCFLGFLGNCKFLGFIQSIKKKKKPFMKFPVFLFGKIYKYATWQVYLKSYCNVYFIYFIMWLSCTLYVSYCWWISTSWVLALFLTWSVCRYPVGNTTLYSEDLFESFFEAQSISQVGTHYISSRSFFSLLFLLFLLISEANRWSSL